MMSSKRLMYRASRNGETVITGTVEDLAEYFHVATSTVGNCERTGRKIHKDYEIERL